jgi:hypothetical protein
VSSDEADDEVVVLTIKVTRAEKRAYEAAADAAKMNRHAWMKLFLNAACGFSAISEQMAMFERIKQSLKEKPVRDGKW